MLQIMLYKAEMGSEQAVTKSTTQNQMHSYNTITAQENMQAHAPTMPSQSGEICFIDNHPLHTILH
jgi:hypothetical protein